MKDSFVIYTKYEEQISLLTDEQAGVLLRALLCYQTGKELPKMEGIVNMIFTVIRQQIDFDNQKYEDVCEARKSAGALGGRPSKSLETKGEKAKKPNGLDEKAKKPNGFSEKQTKAKKPESESDTDTDTDIYPPLYSPHGVEKQNDFEEKFFELYPKYAKDRGKMRSDVDYERLIAEFSKSRYCRNLYTVKQINDDYALIINGDYRDKESPFAGIEAKAERERWYSSRREEAERNAENIYKRFMQDETFRGIDKRLRAIPIEIARAEIESKNGSVKAKQKLVKLTQEEGRLRQQRLSIIELNGMSEEDLFPKWHCEKCKDTGFLESGAACDCYTGG